MSAKAFAFTSLLALTSALRSTPAQRRRDISDCSHTPGTQFYRCSNGYVGCYAQDPCALPTISSSSSTPTTTTPTSSTPTPTVADATPTATGLEITVPRSFNIYPQNGAQNQDEVPHVDLKKTDDGILVTTNALLFENVPSNAQNCRLQWRTEKEDDKSLFFVTGIGLVYSRQLLGWPEGDVTFESLKPFQDNETGFRGGLDFTGWESDPRSHGGPRVNCAEQIAIELKGSEGGDGENRVFIANTKTNGMYLTYDLA
ncbi:hypothetical protein K491DRAFT_696106 [Lophiostoma macrostomum CBS 122681]|uniref:Ubiquitin 3 binding protein But2 C-terminal domain-containing protein n=1 Tax=Lophiostoma macrostomum CBS 122681 TaxID=1314788 RepID=A0A6A6SW17_9PLEO|nr:hypothetical protein K491DRAFT_696106 [Lophiostoma macrostomum CBS 122681]